MGTTLTGTTPQDTYEALIKVTDNGPISGTAKFLSDGEGNDSALALSTSKVGIGTASPTGKLTVSSGAAGGGYNSDYDELVLSNSGRVGINILSSATEFGAIIMGGKANNTTGGIYHNASTNMLSLATQDAFRVNIDNTGNVGIGTSAPAQLLHVSGGSARIQRNVSGATSNETEQVTIYNLQAANAGNQATIGFHLNSTNWGSDYTAARISAVTADATNGTVHLAFGAAVDGAAAVAPECFRITPNGVTFNGDTAAANALDDYEEGTWTMGVSFGGAAVDAAYSSNTGTYTKIGRQVTVNGFMQLTAKGSSTGIAAVTGLPFTIASGQQFFSAASILFFNITFANQLVIQGSQNTTDMDIFEVTEAGALTNITNADFSNNSAIVLSMTYFV